MREKTPEQVADTRITRLASETALDEARKALRCLYIQVPEEIARDVEQRVEAAFAALINLATQIREEQDAELREVLKVILKTVRGDEKSECWTIRKYLDKRGIFNGDIGSNLRLVEEVCKTALRARTAP